MEFTSFSFCLSLSNPPHSAHTVLRAGLADFAAAFLKGIFMAGKPNMSADSTYLEPCGRGDAIFKMQPGQFFILSL